MTAYTTFFAERHGTKFMGMALLFVALVQQRAFAEPTAAEILAESNAAMAKPLKYRLVTSGAGGAGGSEMTVYQKMLPNGSMASLTDMSVPIKKINIAYDQKHYELYLEHRIAIDMQFVFQVPKTQAATILSSLGSKAAQSSKIAGEVTRNGKDCFEIESALSPDVVAALARGNGLGKNATPAKYRYVIEKNTHFMVEMRVISQDGSLLSKSEFRDIKPQPNLSEDFFQVPAGVEVKRPKLMSEYMDLVGEILSPTEPKINPPPAPEVAGPGKFPGFEYEAVVKSSGVQKSNGVQKSGGVQKSSGWRIGLIGFSLVLFAVLAVAVYFRSKKT